MLARLVLLAVNLLPLIGVVFLQWDAFEVLVLYWCETAVIAFWAIVQVLLQPARLDGLVPSPSRSPLRSVGRAVFLSVHAGIFMTVHMMFLWAMFGGAWASAVSGPVSFFQKLIVEHGLWVPLAAFFAMRGVFTLAGLTGLSRDAGSGKAAVYDLYRRIVVLQLSLIAGMWAVRLIDGSAGPAILVGLKIAIDLLFDPFPGRTPREQAA